MRKWYRIVCMAVVLVFVLITVPSMPRAASALGGTPKPTQITIEGEVNNPLTLTYHELNTFPMVSEVAELKCVAGYPDVTGNWTGIPLFYLLTLAKIKSDAIKVVTYGADGYYSDLSLEEALKPTTILAMRDNGTTAILEREGFQQPLPRLIVPNNWGYKWVAIVDRIIVMNTNFTGEYESSGYPDNATRPGQTVQPLLTPPIRELNFALGNLTFTVEAFTNASISAHTLNYLQKRVSLNVSVPSGTVGVLVFALPQLFLKSPYNITIDNQVVSVLEADIANQSYVYAPLPEGFHTVNIVGAGIFGLAPIINVNLPQNIYVGENATFDASKSADLGTIRSYEWSFGDGTNGTGAVVSHSYDKEGTYQLKLNVTDNNGRSSSETFAVTVLSQPQYIPLAVKVLLALLLGLLILMFAALVRSRRKESIPKQYGFNSQSCVQISSWHVQRILSPKGSRFSSPFLQQLANWITLLY